MTFKDGAFTGLTCTVVTHMQLQRDHRLCSFDLQSPRLDTKQCTYLEVALQLLANEFVVEDAASNWKTGPLRLLHYTLERQKHRERTVSGQTQDRVHNSQQPTIVIGSHPALDTWWCCNKSGFYPDSIKLQRVFILTERITADEPLFNVGLNILRNIWRQLVFNQWCTLNSKCLHIQAWMSQTTLLGAKHTQNMYLEKKTCQVACTA